jgi:hypothetical protein
MFVYREDRPPVNMTIRIAVVESQVGRRSSSAAVPASAASPCQQDTPRACLVLGLVLGCFVVHVYET